jgi:hypothetical protein
VSETAARSQAWWDDVEDGIDAVTRDHALPDPWPSPAGAPCSTLTADQEAFLAGLEDQPPVPRFSGYDPEDGERRTGNLPGDTARAGP